MIIDYANEAPPAIISVFIGEQLTKVLAELEGVTRKIITRRENRFKTERSRKIPGLLTIQIEIELRLFFTGNKFEFRAVTANCSNAKH
jgi:glutamine synthetase